MAKQFFGRMLRYLLISVVIFAIVTSLSLTAAFFIQGYLTPAYVSTVGFAAGLFITCMGGFSLGSMVTTRLGGGMTRGGASHSAMRDFKTQKALLNAKDSNVNDPLKFIFIGIFTIGLSLLALLVTGM